MTDDPHKPLREDVRLLGDLLGHALRTIEGDGLFGTVERVRALAKSARGGAEENFHILADELSRLPVASALPVARAFSHFLHLANVAEQHHRIRRRRAYQPDPDAPPQRGSCEEAFAAADRAGRLPESAASRGLLAARRAGAHGTPDRDRTPDAGTEIQPHRRHAGAGDRPDLTAPERDEVESALRREILSAWGTAEVRDEQPTPVDEVRSGLIVFEESLWNAVPRVSARCRPRAARLTGRSSGRHCAGPLWIVDRRRS